MLDALAIGGGVDDGESSRLAARTLEITVARALEEFFGAPAQAVAGAGLGIASRGSRAADLDRRIEQQRQVRTQFRLHEPLEVGDLLTTDAAAVALVRVSRVREAIAHGQAPRSSAGRIRFSMCVARANISSSSHVMGIGSSVG